MRKAWGEQTKQENKQDNQTPAMPIQNRIQCEMSEIIETDIFVAVASVFERTWSVYWLLR